MKRPLLLCIALLFIFSSCGKDNDYISLEKNGVTLYSGDEYTIKVSSDTKVVYKSNDEYIATVSEVGVITAMKIGETFISLNNGTDKKSFTVEVKPRYVLYEEFEFGTTKDIIISKQGTPDNENENSISYYNYTKEISEITYFFNDDKLINLRVYAKSSFKDILEPFLLERYKYIGTDNEGKFSVYINGLNKESANMEIKIGAITTETIIVEYSSIN